jgi:hypothetical protein
VKPEFPVRAKLQLATVAAVVAFGALNAFIVAKLEFATLEEEQQQRVAFAGRLLASRLVEPRLYGDCLAVQKLLEETRSLDESFFAILVFDAAGGSPSIRGGPASRSSRGCAPPRSRSSMASWAAWGWWSRWRRSKAR